ncbi:hypothetical protein DUI87_11344 [Hirundo rustica rustica]|uniref:RNA-directed DNA polymerase n=1 Tax=Hirundo rustica rustica TaxID=333673 RepID=A0A3M0KG52_HIRRU|nr:hypothetical protein DUI87_11344 [Hirundo rustica rustica]
MGQVKKEGAQEQVLEEMALTNANEQCKAAILSLPMEPAPTLDDMLQGSSFRKKRFKGCHLGSNLGLEIGKRTIVPQKLAIKNNIMTLADVQQLSGSLNWREVPTAAENKATVVYKAPEEGSGSEPIHHPFPQSTIRDLCKAHRDYGRDSPYFRGLLRSDLDAAVVIPVDLKQLFSCLLDSTEFKLWIAAWRQQLREALPSLLRDPETAVDDNGNPLTLEHLMGEGRWADPSDQTSDIPIKALQIAREHAVSAFFGMVPDGPVVPYYKIMQGAKESFTKFVERLTRAIEVQVTEVAPILVTSSRHEPYRLRLTEALYLRTVDWTFLSINTKEQGAWPVQGKELVIIGDSAGQAIIYHYVDDVLVCALNDDMLSHVLGLTVYALVAAGFELQEEKVQRMPPWEVPWARNRKADHCSPKIGNSNKRGEELSSPRVLTPEAEKALEKVQDALSKRQAHRIDPELPFKFIIMGKLPHLHGMIFQWKSIPKKDREGNDPLLIIEWVFLSHHRSKRMTRPQELVAELIRKARFRIRELAGCDFECIHIPIGLRSGQISKAMLEHLLQENEALQFALDSFTGQISIHRPAHKIFNSETKFILSLKEVRSRRPLKALTVFTDASGRSHKSVLTWKDPQTQQWEADIAEVEGSPQVAELAAVVRAFERFPEPFNLVTDSAYVAGVVSRADQAILQEVSNIALYDLLSKLVRLVSHREQPYFVMHTRSHTDLPGFIAEGNRKADALAAPAEMAPLPNIFMQAKLSHQLFHQNAPGLVRRFHLTREQARAIVAACPSCSQQAVPTLHAGVNPRGLRSCEVWQTDVTHFPQFGRQKYIHVSVDTFSGAVFASAHTGEKAGDAIKHLIHAFSFMGIPRELKTDNGPAYKSRELRSFLQQWGVEHKTGIPHSPTGQAMVERTHGTIKLNHVTMPSEEDHEEEGLELEEVLEGTPEDEERNLDEEEHELGYPTHHR